MRCGAVGTTPCPSVAEAFSQLSTDEVAKHIGNLERLVEAGETSFGAKSPSRIAYQTLHLFVRTIGCPTLHEKAFPNSGILETTPFTRYSNGECVLVTAFNRLFSGLSSPQAH